MTPEARVQFALGKLRRVVFEALRVCDELSSALDQSAPSSSGDRLIVVEPSSDLKVDRSSFSIIWRGRSCQLRNGLPFRLLEELIHRRHQYVSVENLLERVWNSEDRSPSAVRTVVWELRRRLIAGGMPDLAESLDGISCRGHYRLSLPSAR